MNQDGASCEIGFYKKSVPVRGKFNPFHGKANSTQMKSVKMKTLKHSNPFWLKTNFKIASQMIGIVCVTFINACNINFRTEDCS